ncbi:MAG: LytTR family transcriptional regulator [Bacteroidota bacterium]
MRKDRLYFYTFLAIMAIFLAIAGIASHYLLKASAQILLEAQLESGKREAKTLAHVLERQLANGQPQATVVEQVQEGITGTERENGYLSLFDWSGKVICHPDITQVGQPVSPDKSLATSVNNVIPIAVFLDLLKGHNKQENSGGTSEIICLFPIKDSDWIIAAHANMDKLDSELQHLRTSFYTILGFMGFFVVLASVITVRLIGSTYEKRLESKNRQLESEVINLAKLNLDLDRYQQKVIEDKPKGEAKGNGAEKGKKRILTYVRNELLSVPTKDIAYVFTETNITYVIDFEGRRSTANASLDELLSGLDESCFYRANRQFIVAISAIKKIIRYGNNQLKIVVRPDSEMDIIISKNKAAEFKQWLNL